MDHHSEHEVGSAPAPFAQGGIDVAKAKADATLARLVNDQLKASLPAEEWDEIVDQIEALDTGADDFLTKPFSLVQLRARVKAALRLKEKPLARLTSALDVIVAAHHSSSDGGRAVAIPLDAGQRELEVRFP